MASAASSLVDQMVESGILVVDDDSIRLGDEFIRTREEVARNQNGTAVSTALEEIRSRFAIEETDEVEAEEIAQNALTIERLLDDVEEERRLAASLSIFRLESEIDFDRLPESFVPILGFEIEPFVNSHESAIVALWREDCDPCESVMENIQTIMMEFEATDIELAGVYGPPCSEYIRSNYSVRGAPTILFFEGGDVSSRLVGNSNYSKIQQEIQKMNE